MNATQRAILESLILEPGTNCPSSLHSSLKGAGKERTIPTIKSNLRKLVKEGLVQETVSFYGFPRVAPDVEGICQYALEGKITLSGREKQALHELALGLESDVISAETTPSSKIIRGEIGRSLSFGLGSLAPKDRPVWGARLIQTQSGNVDMMGDRTHSEDEEFSRRVLKEWGSIRDSARRIRRTGQLHPNTAGTVRLLTDDPSLVVLANTNASAGYVYLVAYEGN